jgi:hypothetical protein
MPRMFIRGEIKVEIRIVPTDDLKLDPNNVRFKHIDRVLADAEIEEIIWEEQDTRDLLKSIRAAGGLMERPVVNSEFIVKEGNRRLVCIRRLKQLAHEGEIPELPENTFDNVECELLPNDVSPIDIDIYLAHMHVKGKKPWRRLNQAKHIYELYENLGQSYDAITEYLGMGKRTIQVLNWAYSATNQYLQKYTDRAKVTDFVFFDQLYKRKELRDWLDSDSNNIITFGEWVVNKKIKDPSRELKWLPAVLNNEAALEALDSDNLDKAKEVLERGQPALASQTFKTIQKAIDVIRSMPRDEYLALRKEKARLDMLKTLYQELDQVIKESEE